MPIPVKYNKTLNNGASAWRDIKLASRMHVVEKRSNKLSQGETDSRRNLLLSALSSNLLSAKYVSLYVPHSKYKLLAVRLFMATITVPAFRNSNDVLLPELNINYFS